MAVAEVAAEGEVEGGHGLERDTAIYRDVIAVKETGRAGSGRRRVGLAAGGGGGLAAGGARKREVRFCY